MQRINRNKIDQIYVFPSEYIIDMFIYIHRCLPFYANEFVRLLRTTIFLITTFHEFSLKNIFKQNICILHL